MLVPRAGFHLLGVISRVSGKYDQKEQQTECREEENVDPVHEKSHLNSYQVTYCLLSVITRVQDEGE